VEGEKCGKISTFFANTLTGYIFITLRYFSTKLAGCIDTIYV